MKTCKILFLLIFLVQLGFSQASLTMQEAIKEALANNLQIAMVKNESTMSEKNNSWSNAGANPTLELLANPSISSTNLDQKLVSGLDINKSGLVSKNYNAQIVASWNVLNGFKLYTTKAKLEELQRMGDLAVSQQINQLVYNVSLAYINLQKINQAIKNIDFQVTIDDERIKLAQTKFDIGSSGKNDLLQAQIDKNDLITQKISLQNDFKNASVSLGLLMGRQQYDSITVIDSIQINPISSQQNIMNQAFGQNPAVLLANKQSIVLSLTKKEVEKQRLPQLSVNAAYAYSRNESNGGFSLFNQNYGPNASISLAVPIFDGGRTQNQINILDLQIKNQALAEQQLKLELTAMIQQFLNNYNNAVSSIDLENQNLELARENLTISLGRQKLQSISALELREAQFSLLAIQSKILDYQYLAKQSQINLDLLTGNSKVD